VPDQSIGEAFERHRAHQWTVRARPAAERKRRLQALLSAIVARRETLFEAMHADFRKNRTESELSEIQLVLTELREAIAHVEDWMRPVHVPTPAHLIGTDSEIRYQPRGVVLIMAAWNYPFALIFAPLAGAVAAGNCVMIRPSARVPHTNAVSRAILTDVFPPDELTFVEGGRETADALLALPFDHVFFTGSTPVGRTIMAAAAPHVSSVTLELGGKSPAIVDESADIDEAATRIMWGKFVNGGQTCVAPDYAIVHASRAKAFFDAARNALATFYGATPEARRASDDYCRIIDRPSWTRLTSLVEHAVARGATIEVGGESDASDLYLAPTLLSNVDLSSPIMADEIFGPVLPVLMFQSIDEAIAIVRARPKPLAMYVFGRDRARLETLLRSTSAGGTVINNCLIHLLNPSLPFGGAGGSGFGSYHGRFGFEAFSHARAVVTQGRPNMTRFFRPPYARLRSGWLGQTLAFIRRLRE
jgi:aldehyde dehydrogenase (NAD+)